MMITYLFSTIRQIALLILGYKIFEKLANISLHTEIGYLTNNTVYVPNDYVGLWSLIFGFIITSIIFLAVMVQYIYQIQFTESLIATCKTEGLKLASTFLYFFMLYLFMYITGSDNEWLVAIPLSLSLLTNTLITLLFIRLPIDKTFRSSILYTQQHYKDYLRIYIQYLPATCFAFATLGLSDSFFKPRKIKRLSNV